MAAPSRHVVLAVCSVVVAYALPAFALPPGGAPFSPPEFTPPPFFPPPQTPLPLRTSPLDTVTISNFVKPPKGGADGAAALAFPVTVGGTQPSYTIDLDSRFDAPLVRELPAQ